MPSTIVITDMSVGQMIAALQEQIAKNPSLADASVTYEIHEGGSCQISKIDVFSEFGYIRIGDPRKNKN